MKRTSIRFMATALSCAAFLTFSPRPAHAQRILNTILDAARDAREAAQDARNTSREMRNNMREGMAAIGGDLQSMIQEAVEDARRILQQQREGREEFLGNNCDPSSPCSAFRGHVGQFLGNVGAVASALSMFTGSDARPDLAPMVAMVERAPGRVLLPIYRVSGNLFESDLVQSLDGAADDLATLKAAVDSARDGTCTVAIERATLVRVVAFKWRAKGLATRVLGKFLDAVGEAEGSAFAAGWGFAGGNIKYNIPKQLAIFLEFIGEGLQKAAEDAKSALSDCVNSREQAALQAAVNEIRDSMGVLANLDLSAVSTLATQASLDNLHAAVDGMSTNVTAVVNTRASQESVDALAAAVQELGNGGGQPGPGGQPSLMLRLEVENQLKTGGKIAALLYLPASSGGLLDVVRHVAGDTITQHQALNLPVGNAWALLSAGDGAMANSDFRMAYQFYRQAYWVASTGASDNDRQ